MKNFIEEKLSVDNVPQTVLNRIQELENLLQNYKIITPKEKGSLKITKNKKRYQYYIKSPEAPKGKYLNKKSMPLIKELCQAYYEKKVFAALKLQLKLLKKFVAAYELQSAETIYKNLNEGIKKYAAPLIYNEEKFSELWAKSNNNYASMAFSTGSPELISTAGIRVRSKSEMLIADCLSKNKIPFKYEYPFTTANGITLHPDFICLNRRNHHHFLWEHFGLMDTPEYAVNMVQKDNLYRKNGFSQGKNLIYTFETKQQPFTSHEIEVIIQRYLQ